MDRCGIRYTPDEARGLVREIEKLGRAAVDSNEIFIDGLEIPASDVVGEEGMGFYHLLDSLNPERVLTAIEAVGASITGADLDLLDEFYDQWLYGEVKPTSTHSSSASVRCW